MSRLCSLSSVCSSSVDVSSQPKLSESVNCCAPIIVLQEPSLRLSLCACHSAYHHPTNMHWDGTPSLLSNQSQTCLHPPCRPDIRGQLIKRYADFTLSAVLNRSGRPAEYTLNYLSCQCCFPLLHASQPALQWSRFSSPVDLSCQSGTQISCLL